MAALTILKIFIAFLAGLIPVLIWLWFWEHEDKHPEPKKLTLYAILAGMAGVVIAIPLEQLVADHVTNTVIIFLLWAFIEETLKFALAYITVLRRAENDEPIDSIMYLIATALGFAALENALFLIHPVFQDNIIQVIITGNFRFIGATVLHTIASATIGVCLAWSFYLPAKNKRHFAFVGLILAVLLHTCFNLSIILFNGGATLFSFLAVWIGFVALLFVFEKVKRITKPLT